MFDKYIICKHDFKNVEVGGRVTGFQFKARLPYYRGLGLSMVENLSVDVDSQAFQRDEVRISLHGNLYTLDQMETEYEDRWEFGEEGVVTIPKPGGLTPGQHRIEVTATLRISYLPFLLVGSDAKIITLTL
jgi:hypothetical protein